MKAKNVLREKNRENGLDGMFGIGSPLEKSIISAMKEYAKLKCKEQKEICLSNYDNAILNSKSPDTAIISAPEPDLS